MCLFYSRYVADHFQGVLHRIDLRFRLVVIYDPYRELRDCFAELAGEDEDLKVESKAVYGASAENVLCGVSAETLQPALGVGVQKAGDKRYQLYVGL